MKQRILLSVFLFIAAVGLSGCVSKPEPTPQDPMQQVQEDAGLNQEQMKAQELSEQDDVETLKGEVEGTVFLDEDFSDLE